MAIDDGANVASLLQQCTYAARRAGRLGNDFSHLLPPIFGARIRALFCDRLAAAGNQFKDDIAAWAWAFKTGHSAAAHSSMQSMQGFSEDASSPSHGGGSGGGVPFAPPLSLMRHAPLAELVNGYLLAYNAIRPILPSDAGPWVRNETTALLVGVVALLREALGAPASPLAHILAPRASAVSNSGSGSGATALDADAITALQRFVDLVDAVSRTMAPYLMLVALHLTGGNSLALTGFDNPSTSLGTTLELVCSGGKRMPDARMESMWRALGRETDALQQAALAAAGRAGVRLRVADAAAAVDAAVAEKRGSGSGGGAATAATKPIAGRK